MAYQRWWKTVRDQQGNAINGASCTVFNGGLGTRAVIYDANSDDSSPSVLPNPFVTGPTGVFGFMAQDGEYDVRITGGAFGEQRYRVTLNASTVTYNGAGVVLAEDLSAISGAGMVGYRAPFTGAADRMLDEKAADVVTSADFIGVDPTGASDSADGLNAFLSCGAKNLKLLPGTYKALKTLAIPNGVDLEAYGATIDGSGATFANLTNGYHLTTTGGTWTQIPDLSANVVRGDRTLTFASAPSLVPGDIICIYNPTDYSWSGYRSYYRAGEYLRVAKVVGSTVTIQGTLCDSYDYTAVDIYRLDNPSQCHIRGLTLKGLAGASGAVTGINFLNVVDGALEDVKVVNCSYAQASINQCFNVQVIGCSMQEDFSNNFGGDYGLVVANSHGVTVSGGYYCAIRHGITTGGSSGVGCVPCRFIHVSGSTVSTTGDIQALDFHGNTEWAWVNGCVIDGGFAGGGDYVHLTNNQVKGEYGNGDVAILLAELHGCNWMIHGNTIWSREKQTLRGAFIDIGGNSDAISANTFKGGTISIKDNILNWDAGTTNDNTAQAIKIYNRGFNLADALNVVIHGNVLQASFGGLGAEVAVVSGKAFNLVSFKNNEFMGGGIKIRHAVSSAGNYSAEMFEAVGNYIDNNLYNGFSIYAVKTSVTVKSNRIFRSRYSGIEIDSSAGNTAFVEVSNNTLIDFLVGETSSSSFNTAIYVGHADVAVVKDNFAYSQNELLAVTSNAGFVVGETITGGTSGATAVIKDTRSTTELEIGRTRTGSFTIGETITGGTSGQTTTTTASQSFTQQRRVSLNAVTTAILKGHLDPRVTTDSLVSVTGYGTGTQLSGSATYDPPSLADGAGATTTVTVTGAALGDYASASFSLDTSGITITAWVSAANTVSIRFQNESGGPLDISSGTLRAIVVKP